jgi:hypothetical protein
MTSTRIFGGILALVAATALLLTLVGRAGAEHHEHGPTVAMIAAGDTTDRIHLTTHPHEVTTVRTVRLDFSRPGNHSTAWHVHPGPGLVTIQSGSYILDRVTPRGCIEHIPYGPGEAFVDGGRDVVHRLRLADGSEGGSVSATFLTPQGQPLSIMADPPAEGRSC